MDGNYGHFQSFGAAITEADDHPVSGERDLFWQIVYTQGFCDHLVEIINFYIYVINTLIHQLIPGDIGQLPFWTFGGSFFEEA
jgi:hypothetical protein